MKVDRESTDNTETSNDSPTDGPMTAEEFGMGEDTEISGGFDTNDAEGTTVEDSPFSGLFQGEETEHETNFDRRRGPEGVIDEVDEEDADSESGEDTPEDAGADTDDAPEDAEENPEDEGGEESREEQRQEWLNAGKFAEETGINAENPEEAIQQVNQMKDELAGYSELGQIIQQNDGLQTMIAEMAEGKTPAEAATALDGVQTEAPDPNENPEAYAEWLAAQKQKEQQTQQHKKRQQQRQREIQRKQKRMEEEFENLVDRHDMSDQEAQELGETLARLTVTKPDASFSAKNLEVLRKGLHHDRLIEEARKEERKKVLDKVQGDGTVEPDDGLPDMRSGGGATNQSSNSAPEGADEETIQAFGPDPMDSNGLHGRV